MVDGVADAWWTRAWCVRGGRAVAARWMRGRCAVVKWWIRGGDVEDQVWITGGLDMVNLRIQWMHDVFAAR